jgi:hypothetical protein
VKLREQIRKTVDGEEDQYWSDDDGDTRADDTTDTSTLSTYLETDPWFLRQIPDIQFEIDLDCPLSEVTTKEDSQH